MYGRHLNKKADRLAVQTATIDRQRERGYDFEEYKGLKILTRDEGGKFYYQIFRETASKPEANYYSSTAERRAQAIAEAKQNYDSWEARKASEVRRPSGPAQCAAAMRAELKAAFPGVKFSVTSESFSMGNAVRVQWTDGPTSAMVEDVTGKYQYGHFDGMSDMYEHSNSRDDIPQVKFVSESRNMSEATRAVLDAFAATLPQDRGRNVQHEIFAKTIIPVGATVIGVERTEVTCGSLEEFYRVVVDKPAAASSPAEVSEVASTTTDEQTNSIAAEPGTVQLIDYSAKAFAVIGDTKPIKDKLKELGGSFNARLSCGPGWIFSKKRFEAVKAALLPRIREEVTETIKALATMGATEEDVRDMCSVQKIVPAPLVEYAKQFNGRVAFMTVAR